VVFPVVLDGDTHAHGRAFTMDRPGTYTVTFRAVDAAGKFSASANKTITFIAQQPPKLSIGAAGGNVSLTFTSRANLVYDLQVCTDLESGIWRNVEPHTFIDGYGDVKSMTDPVARRPRAFYRLVEY
jgi:surface-anchored protein